MSETQVQEEAASGALAKVDVRSLAKVERYVTLTSLNIPEGLSYDQWAELGKGLSLSRRMVKNGSLMFWVGDWLAYGEHNIGEAYAQAIEATGYDQKTLYAAKWVSQAIPPQRRKDGLSWSHHRAVASLSDADQDHLLDLALTEKLTYNKLRRMAAAVKAGIADAETATNGAAAAHEQEEALPSEEETQNRIGQALESLKRDINLAGQMVDDFTTLTFAFTEAVKDGELLEPEDLAKVQATAKALSEVTGRIAHTMFALM